AMAAGASSRSASRREDMLRASGAGTRMDEGEVLVVIAEVRFRIDLGQAQGTAPALRRVQPGLRVDAIVVPVHQPVPAHPPQSSAHAWRARRGETDAVPARAQ